MLRAFAVLLAALAPPHLAAWTLPTGLPSPLDTPTTRRGTLALAANLVAFGVAAPPAIAAVKAPVRNAAILNEQLVGILRVKEAASQETRLIKTGKYKELQRLNIKRAIKFMLDNYALRDRFVSASGYAPVDEQQEAFQYAQSAVESLIQIIEYFPQDLQANDLSPEQNKFVLSALASTSKSIDNFLGLMPAEAVAKAQGQVADENRLNADEYAEVVGEGMTNMAPAPAPAPPPPPPPPMDPSV